MKKKLLTTLLLTSMIFTAGCSQEHCEHIDENPKDHICDKCGASISECLDGNKDHNCDLCGKKLSEHIDTNNDHMCDICNEKLSEHQDGNKDHLCDTCSLEMSQHIDDNKDHNCDYCSEKINEHSDSDKNHYCEYCGEKISDHVDSNKDHMCDYCNEKMSEHIDDDNDDKCDYCGLTFYPISIKLADEIKTEYKVGEQFVKPDVFSVYSQETPAVEKKIIASFEGYDISKVGKQTVTVSYITKDSNGSDLSLTSSYDIYVFNYDEMPSGFENAEQIVKDIFMSLYESNINLDTNFNYNANDEEKNLCITGDYPIANEQFIPTLEKLIALLNNCFIKTSYVGAGLLQTGEAAYTMTYIDNSKNFDIEFNFIDTGSSMKYEGYIYKTNKLIEWPASTVETFVSWFTDKEENIPQIEGDVYNFNAKYFTDFGIATVNVYTQENPTKEYQALLQEQNYKLYKMPNSFFYFFNTIAVSQDGEIGIEYGFENGVFTLVFFAPQCYEYDQTIVNNMVKELSPNSNTIIPEVKGTVYYIFYPQLVASMSVGRILCYAEISKINTILSNYKLTLVKQGWKIMDNGKQDAYGGYNFLSQDNNIRINVKTDLEEGYVEIIIYSYIDASNGWPTDEANSLVGVSKEKVPVFTGNAISYEVFTGFESGIAVMVGEGKEDACMDEYLQLLLSLGYQYDEQATIENYYPSYTCPSGEISIGLYTYHDGTFTIFVYQNVMQPGEFYLESYLKDNKLYDDNAAIFLEATSGKYIDWERYTDRSSGTPWVCFKATLQGNVVDIVDAYATSISCEWYPDESCWYNQTTKLEIDVSYNAKEDTTSICFIY